MYKVSVIIPIFNAEERLKITLKSIINQTIGFKNIELILVDDKSIDNSKKIIEEYSNKYKNIIGVYLEENSGYASTPRNVGMNYVTSDYIVFADADDEYVPTGIETLYNTIKNENSDIVISSYYNDLNGKRTKTNFNCPKEVITFDTNNLKFLEKICKSRFLGPWAKIFKKSTLKDNNIKFLEYIGEDGIFNYTVIFNSKKVTITTKPIYIYYSVEDSMIHKHDIKKFYRHMEGMKKTRDILKEHNVNLENMLVEPLEHSLLIFSNLDKKDKKIVINDIYEYEKSLNCKLNIKKVELKFLNNLILNKKFKEAMFISNIYSSLYNNETIKRLYRTFNNKNR